MTVEHGNKRDGTLDPDARTRISESKPDPLVGRTVDGYRIDELLGRGGMGTVYRATQLSLGRPVALKVLPGSLAEDPQFLQRFHREADILSKLSHPGIVTVFDRGDAEGRPYLVMELVEGTSLREVLRKGPLPAAEALVIVRAILSALEHAHSNGVIHRDIKPENVLIAPGGVVKVADFGLSRLVANDDLTRLTRTHITLGTYEYMAPEQREHASEADERSDLYATGVVLYETIAGDLPIGHFMPLSRKRRGECDGRVDAIVERSLAKEPCERYQEATQMSDAVSAVLDRADWKAARNLPTVDAHVELDPLQFASRLDIVAMVASIIGVILCASGVVWVLATTVGGGLDFRFRAPGPAGRYEAVSSFMVVVPSLAFFMFGWFALETAAGLRRFRPTARLAHGTLALAFSPVIAPYSILSWLWLHSFQPRIYYDARARGLDAEQAVSSIADVAYRHPDSPLTGQPGSATRPTLGSWWGLVGSALIASALIGGWIALSNSFLGGRDYGSYYSRLGTVERAMIWVGAAGIAWLVSIGPRVYRTGSRGPIYAFVGSMIFAIVAIVGVGATMDALQEIARGR